MPKTSNVRISAGRWKGRALEVPAGARPTSARAREALFDILQQSVRGARVLDLYAGSGAVGLEAVSRGAARVVLVEEGAGPLERTVSALAPAPEEVRVIREPARAAIARLAREGELFDLIFSDPPYDAENSPEEEAVSLLVPGGLLIVQRDRGALRGEIGGLTLLRRRDYGRNVFLFYAANAAPCQVPRPSPL